MPESPPTAEQPSVVDRLTEFAEQWPSLDRDERLEAFRHADQALASDFFLGLEGAQRAVLIHDLGVQERRVWLRLLPADEAADLIQDVDEDIRPSLLGLLDYSMRAEVEALLQYREDEIGRAHV